MPRTTRPPRWYFSLRSPYSWFAYRELTERHPDVLASIDWLPYWEPDAVGERDLAAEGVRLPVVPMSRAKNFYILQDTRRWASARGWTMRWPVDRAPRWEVPHLAYLLAADAGRGADFLEAASRARWEQGSDICRPEVVAELGAGLGLDADALAGAVDHDELRARGTRCLVSAARDGAFGVPYFVCGREGFWGVERVDLFAATVRRSAPEVVRQPVAEAAVYRSMPEASRLPAAEAVRSPLAGAPVAEQSGVDSWQTGDCGADVVSLGADAGHAGGCG